ncbi:MAG: endonuclease III domain-containing protein [Planctomycetota bacterium]|nr:MAG: endonuclease III domain-containing protein [Planctomycetota bacterium]
MIFDRLLSAYGPQHWWPADTEVEIVVGAILTQNTAWRNVERAIENLKRVDVLSWVALRDLPLRRLAKLIQPSGTYRVKARRLKAFVDRLWKDHGGSLRRMLDGDLEEARRRLLDVPGIGPETADAILLYAGGRPTFVVDAYTVRVLRRHFLLDDESLPAGGAKRYEQVRRLFHDALPPDVDLFNEYHALLVQVGKRHCRIRPDCAGCPLADLPHDEERSSRG